MKHTVKDVRLSYPHLFEAQLSKDGKSKTFNAAFILPTNHPGLKSLRADIEAVGKAKWGAKWEDLKLEMEAGDNLLVHNGNAKASQDGYKGNLYFNANNKVRPLVIDRDRSPLTAEDGKPYGGCYVIVQVDLWAQDNQHGKKINAQLLGVQFMRDGDSFGGGAKPSDASDFEEITDGADADDLV